MADEWKQAKEEWIFDRIELANEEDVRDRTYSCLCGHNPLKELCIIRNELNGEEAIVGNCCIKHFKGMDGVSTMLNALKRGKINEPIIKYAGQNSCINEWEHEFMLKMITKRMFTPKQLAKKNEITQKILECLQRRKVTTEM